MTDATAFEAALRAGGFQEIVRREIPPGDALPDHEHSWEVRGLVLAGRFTVQADGAVQDCGPGEVFTLPASHRHTEAAGPDGAALLIGRRHPA
jgi:quercetin dioxygenase-like cupin family protein